MVLKIKDWHLTLIGWGVLISAIVIRACLGYSVWTFSLTSLAIVIFVASIRMNYLANRARKSAK